MKRLFVLGSICFVVAAGLVLMPHATTAFADAQSDICNGVGATGGGSNCSGSGPSLGTIVQDVVNILSLVVGIVSVIMIIIGGFQYITSQGDSGKIAGAKNTIIYALVGLVVVAFSQALVKFVLNKIGI